MNKEMIRITQIRIPCGHSKEELEEKIRKLLRRRTGTISVHIVRHSIDARKKPQLLDVYTVDVSTDLTRKEEASLVRRLKNKTIALSPDESYHFPACGREVSAHRPVIVGAGPAGLFCALLLAEHGYRPIVLERGKKMEDRTEDVERFWRTGLLDPRSNVQFGEGGAGTFSDGKLNTQVNDRTGRSGQVLHIFAQAGAPESILYEAKPHIGTDRLRTAIPALRKRIEAAGGEFLFETRCTGLLFESAECADRVFPDRDGLRDPDPGNRADQSGSVMPEPGEVETGKPADLTCCRDPEIRGQEQETRAVPARRRLTGLFVQNEREPDAAPRFLAADLVVLAIGHSARDTVEELFREGISMEQKPFAVGLRVIHPQALIDESQYGFSDQKTREDMRLSAAPYKVTARAASGRGVYSFCMCPGGYVVNASSEPRRLCVNGMSDENRDSGWANSAVVVTVGENEFGSSHVLAGMHFQRRLEEKAFAMGEGSIPVERYTDFRDSSADADGASGSTAGPLRPSWAKGSCRTAPLHTLLPDALTQDFKDGMEQFGRKISGFDGPRAWVAGMESRTSSPVRILRGKDLQSASVSGLYPCGEGAGYAGGIMSAAMDGMRVAEAIAGRFAPLQPV